MDSNAKGEECEAQGAGSVAKKDETPAPAQAAQSCVDTKVPADSKSTQARVVRGTKKVKLDVIDSNTSEKKGLYSVGTFAFGIRSQINLSYAQTPRTRRPTRR